MLIMNYLILEICLLKINIGKSFIFYKKSENNIQSYKFPHKSHKKIDKT